MSILSSIISSIFSLTLLVTPASASAAVSGLSFGGKIAAFVPCLSYSGPAQFVTIVPAPATKQTFYIWTPMTLRGVPAPGLLPLYPPSPNPDPPPYVIGQQILGIADIPYFCCPPPSIPTAPFSCQIPFYPYWIPVPPLLGERMQWANQSLLPRP
jgi:hypothetical protein